MPYSRTTATAALAAAQLPKGNSSVVDLLTRVPVNRGSLVKSIENLLKTIESSENAVMIPTLLRDKVRVDAWELLFVAKILKASILGHGDLVEFYMNHLNSGEDQQLQEQDSQGMQSIARGQSSPLMAMSPQLQHSIIYEQSSASSVASSVSSNATATNGPTSNEQRGVAASSATNSSSSTTSWTTANAAMPPVPEAPGSSSSCNSDYTTSTTTSSGSSDAENTHVSPKVSPKLTNRQQPSSAELIGELAHQTAQESLLSAKPFIAAANSKQQQQQRQAQPPSLLQLTTTNNHINSLLQQSPDIQIQAVTSSNGFDNQQPSQPLTISTNNSNGTLLNSVNGSGQASQQQQQQVINQRNNAELRTSRSAGCLFRPNSSGASSPKTPIAGGHIPGGHTAPNTPLGNGGHLNGYLSQAESLNGVSAVNGGAGNELPGDPSALVKLLMQIEQLKASIAHVSCQLESVVELYKRSIDNIST